jgi:hypothetical protein
MPPLITLDNKLLVKDNKLANSLDCCCGCDGPVRLYQCGGLYYLGSSQGRLGTYVSMELVAYDCNDKRVFSWKKCNNDVPGGGIEAGSTRYQNYPAGPGCGFILKGTFSQKENSPPITVYYGGQYGQGNTTGANGPFPGNIGWHMIRTVTWADLNFNGVDFCSVNNPPICPNTGLPFVSFKTDCVVDWCSEALKPPKP